MTRHTSWFSALAVLVLPASAVAQADEALSRKVEIVVGLMWQGNCEAGLSRLAGVKGPDAVSGRKLAEAIRPGRKDRIVAFALTDKALGLAPADTTALLAHAESLAALEQFKEAKALLDRLPAKDAATPSARIVKAEVALGAEDLAAAEHLARGLESDASYRQRAKNVLAQARTAKDGKGAQAVSDGQLELLNKKADALRRLEPRSAGPADSGGDAAVAPITGGTGIHLGGETSSGRRPARPEGREGALRRRSRRQGARPRQHRCAGARAGRVAPGGVNTT